ncbi:MAG TPA: glutamate--tRNA ligase family protein, partial [Gemmataceae bacterium]|nr:glutamate--tRNA ligase family protein [Gemmataceae bacterium]
AWLSARRQNAQLLLRIEDIDSPRVEPEATRQILDDFNWLGLTWDEGPIVQTERLAVYEEALAELTRRELVYPCTCTRTDIDRAASAPHAEHEGPRYPGTCAGRSAADAATLGDRPYAWRLRTEGARFTWIDGFRGEQSAALAEVGGDFVVWKSAGTPAYQLAVVVDDAAQRVTEVVRGDDLVPSTPRQLLLYEMLGCSPRDSFMCRWSSGRTVDAWRSVTAMRDWHHTGRRGDRQPRCWASSRGRTAGSRYRGRRRLRSCSTSSTGGRSPKRRSCCVPRRWRRF